jgi:ubiquinone/menaquinone biosynthesis C-methylase UbiE
VIVRDRESAALARELHPEVGNPIEGADCALSTRPAAKERIADLVRELGLFRSGRPVLGFNVNAYVDTYVRGRERGIGVQAFQDVVASVLGRATRELGADVLLVVTQAMDLPMARQVITKTRARDRIALVSSPPLHYAEITGLLAKVDAFVGMRTHSVILSSSVHTPVGGIIAYPKTRGYLETIDRADGVIEFADFTAENLWRLVKDTWDRRNELRRRLEVSVERERARAAAAALELAEWLGPPANRSESSGAARNRTRSKPIPLEPRRLPAADTRMPQESVYRRPEYAEEYDEDRFGGAFGRYMQDQEVATFLSMAPGPQASILDVGAGTGKLSLAFLGESRLVVAVDGSREMLRVAGAKAQERGVSLASVVCDAQRLCFRDRAFDCAVSSRTLMHLSDWRGAIGELCRVSRCVVLDFPPLLSASGLDALSRRLRKLFSPRVQTYRVFRVRKVREQFERRGFRVEVLERRFLLPVAFHRWLDRPRLSAWIERALGGLCLVWLLGAPVTVKATQQPTRAERGGV